MRVFGPYPSGGGSLTDGQTVSDTIGSPRDNAVVVVRNESLFTLYATLPGAGVAGVDVPPDCWERFDTGDTAWDGTFSITPTMEFSNTTGNALSARFTIRTYRSGEPCNLPYGPQPLVRYVNVGDGQVTTTTTTQVQNDGLPRGTTFIEATAQLPNGVLGFGSNVQITNGGYLNVAGIVQGSPNTLLQCNADSPDNDGLHTGVWIGGNIVPVTLGGGNGVSSTGTVTINSGGNLVHGGGGAIASFDNGGLVTDGAGRLATVAGHATAATSCGVPVPVAHTAGTHITALTDTIIATHTPGSIGLYQVNMRFLLNNGTSGQLIKAYVKFNSGNSGSSITNYFQFIGNAATAYLTAAGVSSFTNSEYGGGTLLILANTTAAIELHYQDPANTPNDFVSGSITRLTL